MKRAFVVGIVVALAFVSVLPSPVRADRTIQWDTTAEWDSGMVFGSDDVSTLITVSDSPSVPPDILQSASVFGDHFLDENASADAETWRWKAPVGGCADGGTQTISDTDTGGVDAADGSLIFDHNAAETSTRSSRVFISGATDFSWTAYLRFSSTYVGGNFTMAVSVGNPNTVLIWCGGITPSDAAEGAGIYFVNGGSMKEAQAFYVDSAGVVVKCGVKDAIQNAVQVRIARFGSSWSFRIGERALRNCGSVVATGAPVFGTFDFVTTGNGVAMVDWSRSLLQQDIDGGYLSSASAFWMSPTTGGIAAERIKTITMIVHGPANPLDAWGFGTLDVLRASDGILLWSSGVVSVSGHNTMIVETRTIPSTIGDGPYLVRLYVIGDITSPTWVESITVVMTGDVPPIPPPPGVSDLPPILDEAIGGTVCGLIFVGFFIVFFVSAKRMKGGG